MLTTAGRDLLLTQFTGLYAGLATAITDWRAGTVTEAAYTSYARQAITFGAAANTTPAVGRQRANSADVSFPTNTGTSEDQIAWTLHDAVTAGNLLGVFPLGAVTPKLAVGDPTAEDIYSAAHGLTTDDRVFVMGLPGGPIPAGLTENTLYYVLTAGLTTDNLRLSATSGGAAINITARGACLLCPRSVATVGNGVTPVFSTGSLIVQI